MGEISDSIIEKMQDGIYPSNYEKKVAEEEVALDEMFYLNMENQTK